MSKEVKVECPQGYIFVSPDNFTVLSQSGDYTTACKVGICSGCGRTWSEEFSGAKSLVPLKIGIGHLKGFKSTVESCEIAVRG